MYKVILLTVFVFANQACLGQQYGTGITRGKIAVISRLTTHGWVSKPDVDGTNLHQKFNDKEWIPGEVKFKSGRLPMNVPLLFDPMTNQLRYLQGDLIMEFVDSVAEITFKVPYRQDSVFLKYKRFYPPIGRHNPATFYRVLVIGKFSLLKNYKEVFTEVDKISKRQEKNPDYSYFAVLPGDKIIQIEPGQEKILNALSEFRTEISSILEKKKLKPNDEGRLINLFVFMNNEIK